MQCQLLHRKIATTTTQCSDEAKATTNNEYQTTNSAPGVTRDLVTSTDSYATASLQLRKFAIAFAASIGHRTTQSAELRIIANTENQLNLASNYRLSERYTATVKSSQIPPASEKFRLSKIL